MYGFVNKILGLVIAFILILLMMANVMVAHHLQARRSIVAEVTNFVDEVTDSATCGEPQLRDLYLACSQYGPVCDVQVLRYTRVVNPDPNRPGYTYTSYVVADDLTKWNMGDICKVHVEEVGTTGIAYFLYQSLGLSMGPVDFSLAGRVRK